MFVRPLPPPVLHSTCGPWPRMSGAERSRIMYRVSQLILANAEELALIESLEVGKPIAQARGEIEFCADLWAYAAGQARALEGNSHNNIGEDRLGLVLREPVGVVGIITPWNFPFIIASERVPWAIGAGCTVVLKPSEFTSGTSIRMAELALEAGVPDWCLQCRHRLRRPGRPDPGGRPRRAIWSPSPDRSGSARMLGRDRSA